MTRKTTGPDATPGPDATTGSDAAAGAAWRIAKGVPTVEETAALAAVLAAALGRAAGTGRDAAEGPGSTGRHRPHRVQHPSPGTWRGR